MHPFPHRTWGTTRPVENRNQAREPVYIQQTGAECKQALKLLPPLPISDHVRIWCSCWTPMQRFAEILTNYKEAVMPNREILTLGALAALSLVSIAALVLSPSAFGAEPAAGNVLNPNHVPGEKLDSGLGNLGPEWLRGKQQGATLHQPGGSPTQISNRVPGEKLDSGLGELPPYRSSADTRYRWSSEKVAQSTSR
jgi:hypothetical protein